MNLKPLTDFRARLLAAERERGQGWSNAATWCAHLYLTQERLGYAGIQRLRRRDGGVHPGKLQALYASLVERHICEPVDDWCFEPALDVPEEMWRLLAIARDDGAPYHLVPQVNWVEIANHLKNEYLQELCL